MKKRVHFLVFTLVSSIFILLGLEFSVRLFAPYVNHQDVQTQLFQEKVFGDSVGWRPNAQGESFGQQVSIDEHGFRKMRSPQEFDGSWVILGDSVTFGVGVKSEDTFIQLLQDRTPSYKLWNTSVVGYSVYNYKEVLDHFLVKRNDIKKVLLFFCLNDIYGNLTTKPHGTFKEKLLSILRRYSKLYIFLKGKVFDRSRTYALYDIGFYYEGSKEMQQAIQLLATMQDDLAKRNIEFLVVLLPYEYQLRQPAEDEPVPQQIMRSKLTAKGVRVLDAYPYFAARTEDSKAFFLFSDAMHLSRYGHKIVNDFLAANSL